MLKPWWTSTMLSGLLFLIVAISSFAAPASFDRMERDYYDWPNTLSINETFTMNPANVYYDGNAVIEREPLPGKWKYVSLNPAVIRILNDKTLQAVGAGKTTLELQIITVKTTATGTTTTTTTWKTTKTISVAAKQFEVVEQLNRTPEAIKATYERHKPLYKGNRFSVVPGIQSPFVAGALAPGFLQDGLRMANFVRYLAGLPNDLVLDANLNKQAQHGAVLNAYWNKLEHTPIKPSSMNSAFFEVAYKSTSTSNLSYGVEKLDRQVIGYMDDLGLNNVAEVGHRRWILNPGLQRIGFGAANAKDGGHFGAMQVFDTTGSTANKVNYEVIGWPASGSFPLDMFNQAAVWSASINPAMYDSSQTSSISVKLTHLATRKIWTLDEKDSAVRESGEYFNISKKGTGIPFAVMFRPSSIEYKHGDIFEVQINGVKHKTQGVKTLKYQVKFFEMSKIDATKLLINYSSTAEVNRVPANREILIYINSIPKIYDQSPIQMNGSVLVPLRGILENLGASVVFNNNTQIIQAKKGARTVSLKIGQTVATVDGKTISLSQSPISKQGRVYVPLRFVSEAFSAKVSWEPAYPAVLIDFDD